MSLWLSIPLLILIAYSIIFLFMNGVAAVKCFWLSRDAVGAGERWRARLDLLLAFVFMLATAGACWYLTQLFKTIF